jgi:hypothetical protein
LFNNRFVLINNFNFYLLSGGRPLSIADVVDGSVDILILLIEVLVDVVVVIDTSVKFVGLFETEVVLEFTVELITIDIVVEGIVSVVSFESVVVVDADESDEFCEFINRQKIDKYTTKAIDYLDIYFNQYKIDNLLNNNAR